jgi:peptidoglycan hydrolase-like protein with peptidoglycan-binding domain
VSVTAAQAIAKAASQVGYREGSGNDNKYGRWYGFNHVAWCMEYLSWVFAMVGAIALIGGKSASTRATAAWFQSQGRWGHTPRAGALAFYNFGGGDIHHVEIVEKVLSGGRMQTLGGNTSSGKGGSQSNGDGVYRRIRSSTSAVVGFGYPAYAKPAPDTVNSGPVHVRGDGGPAGAFPLPTSYWYGPRADLSHNRSGYYAKDRAAIKAIQREVHVSADGRYGPHTYAAVKAWQRRNHVSADGLVGPVTWRTMTRH